MRYHKQPKGEYYHNTKRDIISSILETNVFNKFEDNERNFRKTQIHVHKTKTEYWDKVGRSNKSKNSKSGVVGVNLRKNGTWQTSYSMGTGETIYAGIYKTILEATWARFEIELIYGVTEHSNSRNKLIEMGEFIE